MKKVLFVIRALAGDGAERALSNIITHLPEEYEVDLLLNHEDLAVFPYRGRLLTLDIPPARGKGLRFLWGQIAALAKRTGCLRKLKRENHYDACVSFLDSANISNVMSGNRHCKTVVSIRVSMVSKQSKSLYRIGAVPLMKLLYCHADKIVAVSKEIELEMKKKFRLEGDKITTIVNGYDCENIRRQADIRPDGAAETKGRPIVVTVGRLNEQKGQWHLVRAFARVIERIPDALLVVLGRGELENYLKKLIQANHLENHVALMGYCNNPFWYYKRADVFVLPSMYEGYPNVLAEAVCCGAACVSADFTSGAREILAPGRELLGEKVKDVTYEEYGVLVPVCSGIRYQGDEPLEDSEEKLAEAICSILLDSGKKAHYQRKSRERAPQLNIDAVVQEWMALL